PSPILPGNAFAPSTILLNCFLAPPHISFAIPINLSFIVVTLDMIRPTKEFSILFLICKIDTLNLVLTYSHKSVILLLKFRTKSIIDKIIFPTNELDKWFTTWMMLNLKRNFTYSHKSEILSLKFVTKFIMPPIIKPINDDLINSQQTLI